jgi:hypothetical protein
MQAVHSAVESGKCAVAVAAHLLRDSSVLLELRDRAAGLPSVALSGPAVSPVRALAADPLARALGQPGGVILLVEPEDADWAGLEAIAEMVRAAPHKPRVVVVGKIPQPLRFSMLFRGVTVDTEKGKGSQFLKKLPVPDASALPEVALAATTKKASAPADVPRRVFVGRDDEIAALRELLAEGGPIVVSGPPGVGRSSLIDAAVEGAGLARPVDVLLGRAAGYDHLAARLAELVDGAGVASLAQVVADPASSPVDVARAALDALCAAEALSGTALVVGPLEVAAGRELDFFRKDALGYLVQRLLAHRYPLRLIFVAEGQPVSFDHTASQAVRRLEVGGIKGRFYHEIFDALHVGDVPRDKFGPISERIHGHPLAVRLLALEVRDRPEGAELLDSPKLLAASDLRDLGAIRKRLQKRLEKLPDPLRAALGRASHLRHPATSSELNEIGVGRKERIALVAAGLFDDLGGEDARRYRVHPLVSACLSFREVADFDVFAEVGALYKRKGSAAEGVDRIAWAQEANRCFFACRRYREAIAFRFPDHDPELDAIAGMMRSQKPHFELARERLAGLLKARPGCADAHLLQLELLSRVDAPREVVDAAAEAAMTQAPVPEVFHDVATAGAGSGTGTDGRRWGRPRAGGPGRRARRTSRACRRDRARRRCASSARRSACADRTDERGEGRWRAVEGDLDHHAVEVDPVRLTPRFVRCLRNELEESKGRRRLDVRPALEVDPPGVQRAGVDPPLSREGDPIDAATGRLCEQLTRFPFVRDLATCHDDALR